MKYLYLVTHYYWTLKGENLFDDVQNSVLDTYGGIWNVYIVETFSFIISFNTHLNLCPYINWLEYWTNWVKTICRPADRCNF